MLLRGGNDGGVKAFKINQDGSLAFVNEQSSQGKWPCHLSFDRTGQFLFAVNYGTGNAAVLPVREDGPLDLPSSTVQHEGSSVHRQRQKGPHAHSINASPDNKYVYVADLGIDKIMIYQMDPQQGSLIENDPPFVKVAPGTGPRHFNFDPAGQFLLTGNCDSDSVSVFHIDHESGTLSYTGHSACVEKPTCIQF